MELPKITFDEKEFFLNGFLDGIKIGVSEKEFTDNYPVNDNICQIDKRCRIAQYNGLELFFNLNEQKSIYELSMIFSDIFDFDNENIKYIPWLTNKNVCLADVCKTLNSIQASYSVLFNKTLRNAEITIEKSNVILGFAASTEIENEEENEQQKAENYALETSNEYEFQWFYLKNKN